MQLTFDHLEELQEFLKFCGYAKRETCELSVQINSGDLTRAVNEAAAEWAANPAAGTHDEAPESDRDLSGHPVAELAVAAEPPKRKRRTKAEIDAEKAAATGSGPADATAAVAGENHANPFAQGALPAEAKPADPEPAPTPAPAAAPAPMTTAVVGNDASEFIAARLVERPTLENVAHLAIARAFIGKHPMTKYTESFALAGLSPNVMGYTPEDCARHAAALDFLSLE